MKQKRTRKKYIKKREEKRPGKERPTNKYARWKDKIDRNTSKHAIVYSGGRSHIVKTGIEERKEERREGRKERGRKEREDGGRERQVVNG